MKTRLSNNYGKPIEAIRTRKEHNIITASKLYIYNNKLEKEKIRYDIIEVYKVNEKMFIKHVKNVFF